MPPGGHRCDGDRGGFYNQLNGFFREMARKISEIKSAIAQEWMSNEDVAARYGFAAGESFGSRFGAASVENMLMYVFAAGAWVVESLMDVHREEVTAEIERMIPHRPRWYRDKVLAFMPDRVLEQDGDTYDLSGMSEEEIAAARVVKYAVAVESRDASLLTIKVAGESGGTRGPLDEVQEGQLRAYIAEVKDAGVRTSLVNMEPDTFDCNVDVYYDAMLQPESVRERCDAAIRSYIENLPFNGEYTNMALIDSLQVLEGVRVAEMRGSSARAANESTLTQIDARLTPAAGYFKAGNINITMKAYNGQD